MKMVFNKFNKNKKGVKAMKRLILIIGLLFIVLSVPIFSEATPVDINNPGFENPILGEHTWTSNAGITGWTTSGDAGVWNPHPTLDNVYFSNVIQGNNVGIQGNNVAYTNGPSISQTIDNYFLIPNTQLTLSVDVGWRLDLDMDMPGYAIQLWAGDTLLSSEFSTSLLKGGFVTSELSYIVKDSDLSLGPLAIVLLKTEGTQVNFDNVRLDGPAPVPEPSTLLLLGSGLVGFGYFIRRRKG